MGFLSDFNKLLIMSILVSIYFLVEIVVGYYEKSLALIADSFHMLSDFLALVIAIASTRISQWPKSNKNTFGWQRAEVMGSLINGVMLASLCFVIIIEAIQRFFEDEKIDEPQIVFFVGLGGLVVNLIGLLMLGMHSHSHGGHGHGHNAGVNVESKTNEVYNSQADLYDYPELLNAESKSPGFGYTKNSLDSVKKDFDLDHQYCHLKSCKISDKKMNNIKSGLNFNMRAVFLHVMADFLGSIIVCASALILWLAPEDDRKWKYLVDPILSLILAGIILFPLIPLLMKTALILLQSVPDEICITNLYNRLQRVEYVNQIHDLHVWQLGSKCIIGTVHISVGNMKTKDNFLQDYEKVVRDVKQMFHESNVHCTTIQLEFQDDQKPGDNKFCVFDCPTKGNCNIDNCCPSDGQTANPKTNLQSITIIDDAKSQNVLDPKSDSASDKYKSLTDPSEKNDSVENIQNSTVKC